MRDASLQRDEILAADGLAFARVRVAAFLACNPVTRPRLRLTPLPAGRPVRRCVTAGVFPPRQWAAGCPQGQATGAAPRDNWRRGQRRGGAGRRGAARCSEQCSGSLLAAGGGGCQLQAAAGSGGGCGRLLAAEAVAAGRRGAAVDGATAAKQPMASTRTVKMDTIGGSGRLLVAAAGGRGLGDGAGASAVASRRLGVHRAARRRRE